MTRERQLEKALKNHTEQIRAFAWHFDQIMKRPQTPERGKALARLVNELDMFNDGVRYGILGVDFRRDKPWKPRKLMRQFGDGPS